MVAQSSLGVRLRVLGEFVLSNGEREIVLSSLKSRALLTYLACNNGNRQSRDKLIGLLWGEQFEEQARQSLRHALSELRKLVGVNILQADQGFIQLDPKFASDVSQLQAHLSIGGRSHLQDAVALYQDDLLAGFSLREKPFMDWLSAERVRLRTLVLDALEKLMNTSDESLVPAERLELAQRAVTLDPYREQAHREVLHALVRLGRRNDAIVHYQALEHTLHAELGVEPEPATREAFAAVRSCAIAPDTVGHRANDAEVLWSVLEQLLEASNSGVAIDRGSAIHQPERRSA